MPDARSRMPVKGNAPEAFFTGIRHPSAASIRHPILRTQPPAAT
jgi:hypothetical protein